MTNKLISLSKQELVDCDKKEDAGCEGGNNESVFEFIIQNGGITTEESDPYIAKDGTCNTKKEVLNAAKITGYEIVPPNEEALLKAVAHQLLIIGIYASDEFMQYTSRVFTGECGIDRDQAVLVAGYEIIADGTKYRLMKNSWGTTWVGMPIEEVKVKKKKKEELSLSTVGYLAWRAAQKERVRILYCQALNDTLNWAIHCHLFYEDASILRDKFDANKHLEDPDTIDHVIVKAEAHYEKF